MGSGRIFEWQLKGGGEDMRIFGWQFKRGVDMRIFGWQFKSGQGRNENI